MIKRSLYFIFLIIVILPVLYLIVKTFSGIWQYPALIPESLNFRAMNYIIRNSDSIFQSFLSSLFYSLVSVFFTILISMGPARFLARKNILLKELIETILMMPLFIPGIVLTLGTYPLLLKTGLIDNYSGVILILVITSYPYMLKSLVAGFESYSLDLEISAEMLGVSFIHRAKTIHLPQLLPALISGSIIVFIVSFTEYFLVFLIGGGVVKSFSGYLVPYLKLHQLYCGILLICCPATFYYWGSNRGT